MVGVGVLPGRGILAGGGVLACGVVLAGVRLLARVLRARVRLARVRLARVLLAVAALLSLGLLGTSVLRVVLTVAVRFSRGRLPRGLLAPVRLLARVRLRTLNLLAVAVRLAIPACRGRLAEVARGDPGLTRRRGLPRDRRWGRRAGRSDAVGRVRRPPRIGQHAGGLGRDHLGGLDARRDHLGGLDPRRHARDHLRRLDRLGPAGERVRWLGPRLARDGLRRLVVRSPRILVHPCSFVSTSSVGGISKAEPVGFL